jgi:Fe-S cluster assembly ATP-binding protein
MLEIKDLYVSVEEKEIIKGFSLTVKPGEVHAIMGPNGTGKSTLAYVITGKPGYQVRGSIVFKGKNLLEMDVDERAREGIFLSFQYPVEIPGVSMVTFLRTALNEKRKRLGLPPLSPGEFMALVKEKKNIIEIPDDLLKRSVNEGFSGGEKKRNEIFQMALLEPELAVLDETDSGLDIDALRLVATGVSKMRDGKRSFIVITHYQRLLDYITPDYVHIMYDGRIVKSGDFQLALELEKHGYAWIKEQLIK